MRDDIRVLWNSLPDLRAELVSLLKEGGRGLREIAKTVGVNHAYIIRLSKQTDPDTAAQLITQAAIEGRIDHRQLAFLLGISERRAKQIIKAAPKPKDPKKGGRPPALSEECIRILAALNADPATQHLSHRGKYQILCQRVNNPPSYHTVYRYLNSLPEAYTRKRRERYLHGVHFSSDLPGECWLIDRFRADVFVIDPMTGNAARPECVVIIDKATRAILAIGAAYRSEQTTTRKKFHFDAHLIGSAILQAARGELTGAPHLPQKLLMDWGKTEGADRIIQFLEYHRVLVLKARPYTPHDKAEIEGGVIAPIHKNLESKLPGYCGSDNRPQNQPSCWDGKPKQHLVKGCLVYTDAAGRVLLTIDEFNEELIRYAKKWNELPESSDIRYRNIPRVARLKSATVHNPHLSLQFPETYLLPGCTRTVYEDGTIQIAGRRYYSPALVALRAIYGTRAKVYARYCITDRTRVYLYRIDPESPNEIPTEWLYPMGDVHNSNAHPWERSQATWYNRDEHFEDDPYHIAWENLVRAVNQKARYAINEVRRNPITDHRLLVNFVIAHIWDAVEKHLPNLDAARSSLNLDSPLPRAGEGLGVRAISPVAEAGARHADGDPDSPLPHAGEGLGVRAISTDARPALIGDAQLTRGDAPTGPSPVSTLDADTLSASEITDELLWEIERQHLRSLRERAQKWYENRWR
ncbi:MAG: hypothetical protein D6687_09410 [Acidobacteria bacterium]|nr:MAG: hypothetical protein D6687_09410 [Acidobacteriota bacterium]